MGPRGPGRDRDALVGWVLVAAQFLLIALIVLIGGGTAWTVPVWLDVAGAAAMVAGLLVVVAGAVSLRRGLTPTPLPNACARLRTGGPYRLVRHPIYAGLLLFAIAHTVVASSVVQVVLCLLLVVLLDVKARWEERLMLGRFPDYAAYAARTPRFVPRWRAPA